jgi:hypothetical protein
MSGANSSKWMYMRNTADISLKWNDVLNVDITPNQSYMRTIADILKLGDIVELQRQTKEVQNALSENI